MLCFQKCTQRFNLLFGLASGTVKPEPAFSVIRQPGVAQFTNPYVREYMSRYYPHHMNQLRLQYQRYAFQYARQMVRRPQYYTQQPIRARQVHGFVTNYGEEEDQTPEEEYVSELSGSDDTSSSSEEVKYAESSDDDDSDYGPKKKKSKRGRPRANAAPKFVKYERPAGARSSGRLRGEMRKRFVTCSNFHRKGCFI